MKGGGNTLTAPEDVKSALRSAKAKGKASVLMLIKSGEGSRFVAVKTKSA